jgi:hypothetical protein
MKTLNDLTKEERSLLLYLETRAVDYGGTVDARHMNQDDFATLDVWKKEKIVDFGRLARECCTPTRQYWVTFSEEAWALAHEERRARYARMNSKRDWYTTQEKREAA